MSRLEGDLERLNIRDLKIKWWRLKEGNQGVFVDRVVHEADWKTQDDPNIT